MESIITDLSNSTQVITSRPLYFLNRVINSLNAVNRIGDELNNELL